MWSIIFDNWITFFHYEYASCASIALSKLFYYNLNPWNIIVYASHRVIGDILGYTYLDELTWKPWNDIYYKDKSPEKTYDIYDINTKKMNVIQTPGKIADFSSHIWVLCWAINLFKRWPKLIHANVILMYSVRRNCF